MTTKATAPPTLARAVVLNTGRCGSTLLSELLAQEAQTASISESLDVAATTMTDRTVDGALFWDWLTRPMPQLRAMVRMGMLPPEFRYPQTGRWAGDPGRLPGLLAVTLPALTDDPDGLYDRLGALVPHFPAQPVSAHRVRYLDLLATLTGKRRWVERTGGSCATAELILRTVPEARIVYLTRDPAATAKSMSRHGSFQFAALRIEFAARCGLDPYSPIDPPPDPDGIPADLRPLLPDRITAESFHRKARSPRWFTGFCVNMHAAAERALTGWDPARLLRLSYEDLTADPHRELVRVGEFLDFRDPPQWAGRVAHRVRRRDG
jgi:putative sulfotransferase